MAKRKVYAGKSIVVVPKKDAAGLAAARAASLAAARKAKQAAARASAFGGPPSALQTLADTRRKPALPLVNPVQAVFPGAKITKKKSQPPGSPHPAVGTGSKKALPTASHPLGPKQVVPGKAQTQQTLPPHAKVAPPYGAGTPAAAGGRQQVPARPAANRTSIVRGSVPPRTPAANPPRAFQPEPVASTDPFAGLTPQQIVNQMLAPQYAPLDAQQKETDRLYSNQQATLNDFGGLSSLAGTSQGSGAIPPEFLAALSAQGQTEASYQHSTDLQQITDARSQIAAQAPKLLYDLYTAQTQQQADQAKLALQQAQAANTALYQQQQVAIKQRAADTLIKATQQKFGLDVRKQSFKEQATIDSSKYNWARLNETQRQHKVDAFLSSGRNQIALARVGISNKAEQRHIAELELKARSGGITSSQRLSLQKTAGKLARDAFEGVPVKESGVVTGYNHGTYQGTIRDMLAAGIPLAIAQRALNTYWSTPGAAQEWETPGQGRPKVSFQERQQINAASRKGKRRGKR